MLLTNRKNYHQFQTTNHLLIFNFMYNITKKEMRHMLYKNLASKILSINLEQNKFIAPLISDELAIEKANEFYSSFLKCKLPNIDDKINFIFNPKLSEYEGFCKPTEFNYKGVSKVTIVLPDEKSVKKIVTVSHEKAHAYHMLSKITTTEVVPSFLDILNSIFLDLEYPGIKTDNLNYKIKEAKKASKLYLGKNKKYDVKKLEDYITNFACAIYLIEMYLKGNEEMVKKRIINNLLTGKEVYTYKDNFDVVKSIEFIKKR